LATNLRLKNMHYDNLEYDPIAFLTITLYMVLFVISVLDYFTDSVSLVFLAGENLSNACPSVLLP
jgi:hypothetical protein